MVFMQLSNKMYTEFKRLLTKKRPDLVDRGLIEKSLDDIDCILYENLDAYLKKFIDDLVSLRNESEI